MGCLYLKYFIVNIGIIGLYLPNHVCSGSVRTKQHSGINFIFQSGDTHFISQSEEYMVTLAGIFVIMGTLPTLPCSNWLHCPHHKDLVRLFSYP